MRALELVKRARPSQRHDGAHAAAATGTCRIYVPTVRKNDLNAPEAHRRVAIGRRQLAGRPTQNERQHPRPRQPPPARHPGASRDKDSPTHWQPASPAPQPFSQPNLQFRLPSRFFPLPNSRVQGVYKGCSPGAHKILASTPDEHPLYTPCTRLDGRVICGWNDRG